MEKYFIGKSFLSVLPFSAFTCIIPMLVEFVFEKAIAIPDKEYKKWIYPDKAPELPKNANHGSYTEVFFILPKKLDSTLTAKLNAFAYYELKLGVVFYYFVQQWNLKNPDDLIEYSYKNNETFGWYFISTISKGRGQMKVYLDPDKTILENKIGHNEYIKIERVSL